MEEAPLNGEPVTNFQRWKAYLDYAVSPQSFIDFGFYFLIGAALQRRVWLPPTHSPLYPNPYAILVGKAGLGKGQVIRAILEMLKHHRIEPPGMQKASPEDAKISKDDKALVDVTRQANYDLAQSEEDTFGIKTPKGNKVSFDKPLMFPMAPDATTYEALMRSMSKALRRKDYQKWDDRLQRNTTAIYTHSSLAFCLEEISSLFKKKQEDVAKFFLNAYDCGDYEYDTKHQGKDRIRKCCLSMFGGTTPEFMQELFSDRLLTDGFASRTWFIYETQSRERGFFIPALNDLQEEYKKHIMEHVGKLGDLYGQIQFGEGVMEWLEAWWEENKNKRPNRSARLESYYSRRKVHIQKLAIAIHFAESLEMTIQIPAFQRAIEMLATIEHRMHLVLDFGGANPLHKAGKKLIGFIAVQGRKTYRELLGEIFSELPKGRQDFDDLIEHLMLTGEITKTTEGDGDGAKIYYDITKKKL